MELAPIASATRVVFLQHPRESRVAIGTCRMAHLALAGSELHRGVSAAAQALSQHHSLLVGALLSCDSATQRAMLEEHRSRIVGALDALGRLGTFLDQCRIGSPELAGHIGAAGVDGAAPV